MPLPSSFISDNAQPAAASQTPVVSPAVPQSFVPDNQPNSLTSQLSNRAQQFGGAISHAITNLPNALNVTPGAPASTIGTDLLHVGGALGGAVTDVAGAGVNALNKNVLTKIPGVSGIENDFSSGMNKLGQSPAGQAIGDAVQKFGQQNPDIAGAFKDASDLASGTGLVMGGASLYGNIRNRIASGGLTNALVKAGVSDPEGVASTLTEHGIVPGQTTWKQGIKMLGDSVKNVTQTIGESSTMDSIEALNSHLTNLQNALEALRDSGPDILGSVTKPASGLLKLTGAVTAGGLLGNALQNGGKFLYNKFVGQSPWSK